MAIKNTMTLSIKGHAKSAKRAAHRHGVNIHSCTPNERTGGVYCQAPCSAFTKVQRWYGERASLKQGRGNSPGALLYFTNYSCERGELRGTSRKRRKARR